MDTNRLKKFARDSRSKLLSQVEAKLNTLLVDREALTPELREKENLINEIKSQIKRLGKEQFIEKIAYTWFNRFTALRFMDANNLTFIQIVSPPEGFTLPEILSEAKNGYIDDRLKVDRARLNKILDGQIPSANPQGEVYKALFIASCNYYNRAMPFMFEKITDYTELLLPDDLLSENSVLMQVVKNMTTEDCQNVELIGWLYQFYISEKKDEVIQAKKRYKKEEIPAATQLFTPHWIVKYMVENTLGRMWLEARPNSNLKDYMEFYIQPEDEGNIPPRIIPSPEEITFLDPASGSAHILVYAFELFTKIYEEEGYDKTEIPKLILEKNLYGLEIDERAASLGSFALTMKAAEYHKRYLRKPIEPKIYVFEDSDEVEIFKDAKTLGSLIRVSKEEYESISVDETDLFNKQNLKNIAWVLSNKFDCVVTNPPYVNGKYFSKVLADFTKNNYKETKSDLFAAFVIRCRELAKPSGFVGQVTPFVWMFIKSYEYLRETIIETTTLLSLVRPSYTAFFDSAIVPLNTFVFRNERIDDYISSFFDLDYLGNASEQVPRFLDAINNPESKRKHTQNQQNFKKIPGSPIAYWVSERVIKVFSDSNTFSSYGNSKKGISTSNNDLYLKLWHEVKLFNIEFNNKFNARPLSKWVPYNKGGEIRKWFGNNYFIIDWEHDGHNIRNFNLAVIRNESFFFLPGFSWTDLTSSMFSARYFPHGHIFDASGPSAFSKNYIIYLLGFVNTNIANFLLNVVNPTMHYGVANLADLPIILFSKQRDKIEGITVSSINLARTEWDSRETSWDFKKNELLRLKENGKLLTAYDNYRKYWKEQFYQLHKNEEELNRIFIDIYGLQEELTPDVDLKDITILKQETHINENGDLVFNKEEIIKQFISYSVGCMQGRYSLDKEGLILANQGETLEDYIKKVYVSNSEEAGSLADEESVNEILHSVQNDSTKFIPDDDAIIPVLEDEYFTDDITGRFREFLKVTFGTEHYEENIAFVEEALGKDIRKYFAKDFYADHIKRYKKRPIYWMFSSPKKSFNVLVYMHRYKSDTVSKILNDYLREYQEKLKAKKEHLTHIANSEDSKPAEKNKALKEINKIDNIQAELQEYERDILYPLATQRIEIDLDDGVKVNYNKFGKAVQKVAGLSK